MNLTLLAAIALICAWIGLVWHALRTARSSRAPHLLVDAQIAVIYASQTGTAKEIAQRTAGALGPQQALLLPMSDITLMQLREYQCVLFIVSTYGEGDPPDMAQAFYSRLLGQGSDTPRLDGQTTAVLALGDSSYHHYCGFGKTLSRWLERQGAKALFDTIQVDKCDQDALLSWTNQLNKQFQTHIATKSPPVGWRVLRRRHLNPGSTGGACYELVLEPIAAEMPFWCAGDIAEVEVDASGVYRDYSIASTPAEGVLCLLVRQYRDADGKLGVGSHHLTVAVKAGDIVLLRIRENSLFHAPSASPPAIFIGNGTGIAALRSLLQARVERGHNENWLIFGERQRACDFFYEEPLSDWHTQKKISRLDLAFSRDQDRKHYVQDILRNAATAVREWVAQGAIIYVCGSKNGMATDVDKTLQEILGSFGYAALLERQAYRRDVY